MRLEIGNFYVKDIVFGRELSLKDGTLTINKEEALKFKENLKAENIGITDFFKKCIKNYKEIIKKYWHRIIDVI